jgi:TRAP-type C4-dicarboxylate transport system permease small subunit
VAKDIADEEASRASSFVSRLVIALTRFCGAISALLIILTLIIVSYAIIQRYVLQTPLLWGDELIGYLLVTLVMLGTAEALRQNDHISIDLLTSRASPRYRRYLRLWSDFAVFVFAAVLGWSTWKTILFAHDFGEYSSGYIEIPTWIPQVPMLIGMVLLALVALNRALKNLVVEEEL